MERLRAIPLFSGLPERSLRLVARLANDVEVPAGRLLIERGMPGAGLFVIRSGKVKVELPRGRTRVLGPGEIVGELALLTPEGRRTARVRATSDVTCLCIARKDFERLLREEPRIGVAMLPGLARRATDARS
jgi:CRP-like cAMP-binding protein